MATYYVRPDGNDSNTGLGSTTALAWQTFGKAFAAGSPIVGGDTVYIAPGTYVESITVNATSPTSEVNIIGNATASQFIGVSPGVVRLSSWNAPGTSATFSAVPLITGSSKNYYSFQNIHFDGNHGGANGAVYFTTSRYLKFIKCVFTNYSSTGFSTQSMLWLTSASSTAGDFLVDRCTFGANNAGNLNLTGSSVLADTTQVKDCLFIGGRAIFSAITASVFNCSFIAASQQAILQLSGSANAYLTVKNSLFLNCSTALSGTSTSTCEQTYCRFAGNSTNLSNFPTSVTSQTTGNGGVDIGYSYLSGLNPTPLFASYSGSPNTSFGITSGAPAVDLFSISWSGSSPDAGSITNGSMTGVSAYLPGNQIASTITIAPGSTSQSIELYLGATGLKASTSGLSARYNRTRTASVSIPLVARTIGQAWTSGGFAEVDATNMPGVYRLDVPDAALAAGADDVTVVVRGASGTNGAVMTIKLSSGGLTSAQTASAVWGADVAGYVAETNFGGVVNATRNVSGNTEIIAQDIPSNVWEEVRANHTTAGTFGEYVNTSINTGAIADAVWDEAQSGHTTAGTFGSYLDSKVSDAGAASRIQLRQGPFLIKQNAVDSVITEVNQFLSTVPNIEMVLIDSSGGSVSVAGATLVMRVRNQAGTAVVNNVTPTVAYADGGVIRWSPNLSWTALGVTTAGTYRIVVERTMSGVTTTFGPFLVQLSSG